MKQNDCLMMVDCAEVAWCACHRMSLAVTCMAWKQLGRHWRHCTCICYPPRMLH